MVAGRALAGPAPREATLDRPRAQRRSMRMIHLTALALVDLPVDSGVVLEQKERAGQAKRIERTPAQGRCSRWGEHVFVS